MSDNPLARFRIAVVTTAALGLIALSAGPVAADTTPPTDGFYTQNGSAADLYSSDCIANGDDTTTCVDQQLSIFIGKMSDSLSGVTHSSQLCIAVSRSTFSDLTGEYVGAPVWFQGCRVDLPSGTIRIDSKLTSATLAATHVTVQDQLCEKFGCEPGSSRDIVVAATWTGFGPLSTNRYRGLYDDGTCRSNESYKGTGRSADVAGSIDGAPVAGDRFGFIQSGKSTFRSSCSEV